jgi:hypothetical protein
MQFIRALVALAALPLKLLVLSGLILASVWA